MNSVLSREGRIRDVASGPAKEQFRRIVADWEASGHADTLAALEQFPHLRLERDIVMELAYEEYVQRTEKGERIEVDAFCRRFPDHLNSVRTVIEAQRAIDSDPALLGSLPVFHWPEPGEWLDDFRIIRRLGRGGLAHVYLARHIL